MQDIVKTINIGNHPYFRFNIACLVSVNGYMLN
ncbi:hypothetical protein Alsa3_CDS0069 [Staphylococcus phage Alsa_3]|nr:hypothetical protein Alsa2_CDS0207 [Staphylococcus phage Alsa_2]WNM50938.1 hypothetical protein Alsa3_CDS0069 [Staphylococcus phage Alsa_3]WNM51191.1 hypothetical protein Alsa4_CDS0061 [Staphylococcus phage Alsa_4]WNM56093.1 hypothetical protein CoNPh38_CDS0217 [Staphylococcus phage S-CoN_Ph38]